MENHLHDLAQALVDFRADAAVLDRWGRDLAGLLDAGGRLLACGNGGSAAQAQHLTAELVGRYDGERQPFPAVSLHCDTSAVTAIVNDYGADELFARQVRAHGRPGDVLVCLSTSGSSGNVLAAARAAADLGVRTWALTGPEPNPLAAACDEAVAVEAPSTATVQEIHLVAVHMICESLDAAARTPAARPVDEAVAS
ncbi:D-sedoheptulose-7-phosphate isomerase [Actinomadura rubteroloni]|nr:SIS domain-containing protein [Actinomadura rubteroloni]